MLYELVNQRIQYLGTVLSFHCRLSKVPYRNYVTSEILHQPQFSWREVCSDMDSGYVIRFVESRRARCQGFDYYWQCMVTDESSEVLRV